MFCRLIVCLVGGSFLWAGNANAQAPAPYPQYPPPPAYPQPTQQPAYPPLYPPAPAYPQRQYHLQYPPAPPAYPQAQYAPPPGYYYPPPPLEPPKWSPGEPAPPGYHVERRTDWEGVGQAAGIVATFWVISVIGGAILNESESSNDGDGVEPGDWNPLYVPVVGPFFVMRHVDTADAGWALLLLDGVAQTVGTLGVVIALSSGKERLERNDAPFAQRLRVLPSFAPGHAGLRLSSQF